MNFRKWFTSERVSNLGIAIFLSSTIAVIITGFTISSPDEPSLGEYISPQRVLNRIPGAVYPSAYIGESITVSGVRCINEGGINVLAVRSFVETRTTEPRTAQGETIVSVDLPLPQNACGDRPSQPIKMPVAVEPGWWKISAFNISLTDGEIRFWESEEFEVVGR